MLICILGNLASGKTTVCYALNKLLQYKLIVLDEYRIKYNKKCTREGEIKAQLELIKNLNEKNIILECTGVGRWFTDYLLQYSLNYPEEEIKKFKLIVPMDELYKRVIQRDKSKYKKPPFPYKELKEKTITENLLYCNRKLKHVSGIEIPNLDIEKCVNIIKESL